MGIEELREAVEVSKMYGQRGYHPGSKGGVFMFTEDLVEEASKGSFSRQEVQEMVVNMKAAAREILTWAR